MWKKREVVVAVTCLVVGSVGQLVQYVVTPVGEGETAAAKYVAKAVNTGNRTHARRHVADDLVQGQGLGLTLGINEGACPVRLDKSCGPDHRRCRDQKGPCRLRARR